MTSESKRRALTGRLKSKITGAVVSKLVSRFGIPDSAVRNLRSWARLSAEGGGGFPTELLPLGANMWSGFVLTTFTRQLMADTRDERQLSVGACLQSPPLAQWIVPQTGGQDRIDPSMMEEASALSDWVSHLATIGLSGSCDNRGEG